MSDLHPNVRCKKRYDYDQNGYIPEGALVIAAPLIHLGKSGVFVVYRRVYEFIPEDKFDAHFEALNLKEDDHA